MKDLLNNIRESFDSEEEFKSYCSKYGLNKLTISGSAKIEQIEPENSNRNYKFKRYSISPKRYMECLKIYEAESTHYITNEVKGNLKKVRLNELKEVMIKILRSTLKYIILGLYKLYKILKKLGLKWLAIIIMTIVIINLISRVNKLEDHVSTEWHHNIEVDARLAEIEDRLDSDKLAMMLLDATRPTEANPSDSTVWEYIKNSPAWYPNVIMAQYIIESGHGESGLSRNYNNYFGIKVINQSNNSTTQIPNAPAYDGYGVYKNWKYSVIDRLLWDLRWFKTIPTIEEYLNKLGKLYAEDPNYVSKIIIEAENWR